MAIIISFKINQDYIATTLCINRDKPELLCSGKCVLVKNLKADDDSTNKKIPQKARELNETVYYLTCPAWPDYAAATPALTEKSVMFYLMPCSAAFPGVVFHPPDPIS